MKRLLTCLFLVLGLGLVFSVNANALFFSKYFCINNPDTIVKTGYYFGKASKKEKCDGYALSKKNNKQLVSDIGWMSNKDTKELARLGHPDISNTFAIITRRINKKEINAWKKWKKNSFTDIFVTPSTYKEVEKKKVAKKDKKKEPTQTQQIAKKTKFDNEEYIKWKAQSGKEKFAYKVIHTDTNKIFEGRVRGTTSRSTYLMAKEQAFLRCENSNEGKINLNGCVAYDKTQIAKIEPTIEPKKKKKKVAKESIDNFCFVNEVQGSEGGNYLYFHINDFPRFKQKWYHRSGIAKININNKDEILNLCAFTINKKEHPKEYARLKTGIPLHNQQNFYIYKFQLKNVVGLGYELIKELTAKKKATRTIKLEITAAVFHPNYYDLDLFAQVKDSYNINKNVNKSMLQEYQYNFLALNFKKALSRCEEKKTTFKEGVCKVTNIKYFDLNDSSKNQNITNKDGIEFNDIKVSWNAIAYKDTLIAKKEPKKKKKVAKKEPKKKIVKVAEQEQEEFKPKKKNIDNDPPIIEIAEAITVDSQAYTLKGKVKDKSKQIYLTIDGRAVEVNRGKFTLDRFNFDPEIVEEIKIVAIDKWNNKSEKIVKVTVKLKATEVVKIYEELKPNKVKVSKDDNKIAIIIGIEKYENLTNIDAKFANNDAKAFRAYAERALGVKSSNVKILIGKKATRSQTLKAFKLWLPKIAGEGKDIYIFFAGHGLASDNGKDLYILPQDGESSLLEDTAISRVQLISLIQKVNPKSVTMFFDTCYSGQTRGEQMLVASLRPIRIVAGEQDTPNNFTIFSASNFDQTSGSIKETKHGMFSYYLMKGLEGKADGNKDKQITNGELIAYLKTNVSKEAFTQNREQDPMLSGDPDQVLMKY